MIVLRNVGKTFRTASGDAEVLADINISIEKGEIFGVIGRSGAGKSTLVRLINLLERPSAGSVIFDGEDVTDLKGASLRALRRRIGMIFQHFNLLSARTVAGNIAYPLEISHNLSNAAIRSRVTDFWIVSGFRHMRRGIQVNSPVDRSSASALRAPWPLKPSVLLCDEATSALDPQSTLRFWIF